VVKFLESVIFLQTSDKLLNNKSVQRMPVVVDTIAAEEEDNIKTLRLCYSPKGPNIESNSKAKSKELPTEDRNWLSVASLSKPWMRDSSHHVNLKQHVSL
jgi:hypothetical protein